MKVGANHLVSRSAGRAVFNRRVEKANRAGRLADDSLRQSVPPVGFFERRRSNRSSRFETRASCDLEQNETPSVFVAQVLGQVLDAGRQSPIAAGRVYAHVKSSQKEKRLVGIL